MEEILKQNSEPGSYVVYGVYDSVNQPWTVRLHDFWVDRSRVPVQEKSYFFHLLATMLDAGIPIVRSLQILSKKTQNERFQRILNTIAYDVERGQKMSQSMLKFTTVFKESERGVIRSGEAIGQLPKLLFRLSDQSSRLESLSMKIQSALTYPVIVLLALLASLVLMVTWVIPKISVFFTEAKIDLPWLTRAVLAMSAFFSQWFWLLLFGFILAMAGVWFYLQTENGRAAWHLFLLRFFMTGDLVRKRNVAESIEIMSLLLDGGVPIHEAISIASEAVPNIHYQRFLMELKSAVERGETLESKMKEAPFLYSESLTAMIGVGESSGQLTLISQKLAKHYEEEIEYGLTRMTTLLEPLVMLVTGVLVGLFALAVLGPIFSLSSLVTL